MEDQTKDNIKIDFKCVGCEVEDWISLAQSKAQWKTLANILGLKNLLIV
jgi:hypothetical protein